MAIRFRIPGSVDDRI